MAGWGRRSRRRPCLLWGGLIYSGSRSPSLLINNIPTPRSTPKSWASLDYESLGKSLLSSDHDTALNAAKSLRDRIEIVHTAEFPILLRTLLPALESVLTAQTRPNPQVESAENRLRHAVLEILSKFPHNETLRPHSSQLLALAMDVLTKDYEENALVGGRMVFDLHKNFRLGLGDGVQSFLDFIMACYRGLGASVIQNFGGCRVERYLNASASANVNVNANAAPGRSEHEHEPDMVATKADSRAVAADGPSTPAPETVPDPAATATATAAAAADPTSPLHASTPASQTAASMFKPPTFRSTSSFKVLTECPLTVMLLFQLHPKCMKGNISVLIPLMMDCLGIRGPSFEEYAYNRGSPKMEAGNSKQERKQGGNNNKEEEGNVNVHVGEKKEGKEEEAHDENKNKNEDENVRASPLEQETKQGEEDGNGAGESSNSTRSRSLEEETEESDAHSSRCDFVSKEVLATLQSLAARHHTRLTRDLIAAQVKTLSFLTYLLRGYSDEMVAYTDRVASSVVHLMQTCPRDTLSTRKELLVATRHILASEFRSGFYRRIDTLLDDRVLVGTARPASNEVLALRPLGYSALADLVHHVRSKLSMGQVNRVVSVFGRAIHDAGGGPFLHQSRPPRAVYMAHSACPSSDSPIGSTVVPATSTPPLPLHVRITSVRLLLNLVDHVYQNRERDAQLGRDVLYRILDILVRKLENVKEWGVGGLLVLEEIEGNENDKDTVGGFGDSVVNDFDSTHSKSNCTTDTPNDDRGSAGDTSPAEDKGEDVQGDEGGRDIKESDVRRNLEVGGNGKVKACDHWQRGRKHAYLRSLASNSSYPQDGKYSVSGLSADTVRFIYPPPTHEQLHSIQSLVRPIIVGIKTLIWCINAYGGQRQKSRRDVRQKASAEVTVSLGVDEDHAAGSDKPKPKKKKAKTGDVSKNASSKTQSSQHLAAVALIATMGKEDSPLAVQKLTSAERELIDRFGVAALGCLEVFRVKSRGPQVQRAEQVKEVDGALIDFGRWPSRNEVLSRQGYSTDCLDDIADGYLLVLPLLPTKRHPLPARNLRPVVPEICQPYQIMVETFAATYSVLDPYNLRRILGPRLHLLFDAMVADPFNFQVFFCHMLLGVGKEGAQGGVEASGTYDFCDILVEFLTARLSELRVEESLPSLSSASTHSEGLRGAKQYFSNDDECEDDKRSHNCCNKVPVRSALERRKAVCIIRLFEVCLSSMTPYPKNEEILRPKLQIIVATCLRCSMEGSGVSRRVSSTNSKRELAGETLSVFTGYNYLHLLRSIFRAISGGKFEESYKIMLPLLPATLNGLWRIYGSISPAHVPGLSPDTSTTGAGSTGNDELDYLRHIIIDLCLTIPARLSSLLPHLPLLVRVIIPALRCDSGDLVNLGLRTLEFWVDNLNPIFLYPILSAQKDVLAELMIALTNHLRPAPYPYGLLTLRLLGKLGGGNRLWLGEPLTLSSVCGGYNAHLLAIECEWSMSPDFVLGSEAKDAENRDEIECDYDGRFALPLPLARAVTILRTVAFPRKDLSAEFPLHQEAEILEKENPKNVRPDDSISFQKPEGFLSPSFYNALDLRGINLSNYCADVLECVKHDQALAALTVTRCGLAIILESPGKIDFNASQEEGIGIGNYCRIAPSLSDEEIAVAKLSPSNSSQSDVLYQIIRGLFYGSQIPGLKDEAMALLVGLSIHMFLISESHKKLIISTDQNGKRVDPLNGVAANADIKEKSEEREEKVYKSSFKSQQRKRQIHVANAKIHPLPPFGIFSFTGPLENKVSPFLINEVIVSMLCEGRGVEEVALELIEKLAQLSWCLAEDRGEDANDAAPIGTLFFESLLTSLLNVLFTTTWPCRTGIYHGVAKLLKLLAKKNTSPFLGREFVALYEVDLVHVALFCLKDCSKESSIAAREAVEFYLELWSILYGKAKADPGTILTDCLATEIDDAEFGARLVTKYGSDDGEEGGQDSGATREGAEQKDILSCHLPNNDSESPPVVASPSPAVWHLLLSELCSTKQLLRFCIRHSLCHLYVCPGQNSSSLLPLLKSHMTTLKRCLFSRSLRILPLPDQVGIVEALAFLIHKFPDVLPLSDQHLLAFLSELLKMLNIADGEMIKDADIDIGVLVDKDGHVVLVDSSSVDLAENGAGWTTSSITHPTAIYLRSEILLRTHTDPSSGVVIPPEVPLGVQLRIASLALFRAVIKNHTDTFFHAGSSAPIGNIRPHVISLFFRSLVSKPHQAVATAHAALRDVLSLSAPSGEGGGGGDGDGINTESTLSSFPQTNSYCLPKELLQTCIRPVLLDLRDYTKLSLPLLRGISRLLSLLSTWFNQTLGEKLLDHLQKFTDPDNILGRKLYEAGDEPLLAAGIIDLFELLPHSSHFVEPLVKTSIRLESVLPRYRYTNSLSPFRAPLAKYLNKNCQNTIDFFVNQNRLKNPLYSDLFRDIIQRKECKELRTFLGSKQSSITLLNVCFERPLAIIRAEKALSGGSWSTISPPGKLSSPGRPKGSHPPKSAAQILQMHGIHFDPSSASAALRQREMALRQDMETKSKKMDIMKKEEARLQARIVTATASSSTENGQGVVHELKRQHQIAQAARETTQKEFQRAEQAYSAEITNNEAAEAQRASDAASGSDRPMTVETLELQYQGFKIIQTLVANDKQYLRNHNDIVRAFRWLWRSKGRHLRLIHEESLPPRYHEESDILATCLIEYSQTYPNDVDVLFDLLRIFLQPTSFDFTFVKAYLVQTASGLTARQKRHVISRFFALLNSDGTEDTKVLSIQVLLLPMLQSLLVIRGTEQTPDCRSIGQPALEGSIEKKSASAPSRYSAATKNSVPEGTSCIIDGPILRKFIKEALLQNGTTRRCGNRLCVELLKISSLLLEFFWYELIDYRKDILRFAWSQLKNDDIMTKHWAYVNVTRFISVYETPAKIIHQVYVALLRSYQPEAKDLVRLAFDLLIPALLKRLQIDDFRRAIKYTNKVMYEEGSSIPQLAHIWHIIVRHPEKFYRYRHLFVPQMINSLNRLGLPTNSPYEYRELSVRLVEQLLAWEAIISSGTSAHEATGASKNDTGSKSQNRAIFDELLDSPPDKNTKLNGDCSSPSTRHDDETLGRSFSMDQGMVNEISNFLVRLTLLAGDSTDGRMKNIGIRTVALFDKVMSMRPKCEIRTTYFEKVAAMCNSAVYSNKSKVSSATTQQEQKEAEKISNSKNDSEPGKKDSKPASMSLLVACLDLFIVILEHGPSFLYRGSNVVCTILAPSFDYSVTEGADLIRSKLREFILSLFTSHLIHEEIVVCEEGIYNIRCLIERILLDAAKSHASAADESIVAAGIEASPSSSSSPGSSGEFSAYYILESLGEISTKSPGFIENFTETIVVVAEKLTKIHAQEASLNTKHMASAKHHVGGSGYQKALSSPVSGIFEEGTAALMDSSTPNQSGKLCHFNELHEPGTSLLSLMACIRLVAVSSVSFTFNRTRVSFFDILVTILESSDSIHLLMSATKLIGKWLLEKGESGGPLTLVERMNLLSKLTQLEYRGLPEVMMQPLVDHVACIIAALHNWDPNKWDELIFGRTAEDKMEEKGFLPALVASDDRSWRNETSPREPRLFSGKSIVSCLLTGNPRLRSVMTALYFCTKEDTAVCCGKNGQTALGVLWQLLHSNFEGLGEKLWIIVFVDLLLACSSHDGTLKLAGNNLVLEGSVQEKSFHSIEEEHLTHWLPSPARSTHPILSGRIVNSTKDLVEEYTSFLSLIEAEKRSDGKGRGQCVSAVRGISHGDVSVCQGLFERLISVAWARMPNKDAQSALISAIESLLAESYHAQFLKHSHGLSSAAECPLENGCQKRVMNVIQSFLRALSKLHPAPQLSTDLLMYLAAEYNSWYEVLHLLEIRYHITAKDLSPESAMCEAQILSLMNTCYFNLDEGDVCLASIIAFDSCLSPETVHALSLDVYGKVEDALSAYSDLIDQAEKAQINFEDSPLKGMSSNEVERAPTEPEISLWEERWVELNREMSQWEVLLEFAESSAFVKLEMECAWKTRNWDKVRSLCLEPSIVASLETGDPQIKMSEVFLSIVDGKLELVENLHAQTAQLCLYKWQLLPSIATGGNGHCELLKCFHRLVELRESGQIMVETSRHSGTQTFPDLKNLLSAWRQRLPNEFDPLSTWEDIFVWRGHMFHAIATNFGWGEPETLASLHDRPWIAIKATQIARKQCMNEAALLSLNNLTDCAMDVSDAFSKLREQIISYERGTELERTGGLNLINTTNLSFFNPRQKSELFRLKGNFLTFLGGRSKANQTFCHAVQISPSYSKTWVSWGGLCASLGYEIEQQGMAKAKEESNKEVAATAAKKAGQYLAQGMGCYLEAILCDTQELTRLHLPMCLWMLTKDGHTAGVLCQTLETRGAGLPPWVWLPWVSQLLTSLCRVEGGVVKDILGTIVAAHPQSVYFALRAFYLERRDIERTRGSGSTPSHNNHNNSSSAVGHAEELMSILRRAHPTLWGSLETILEELIVRFRPTPEEELLATVAALLQRAESQLERQNDPPRSGKTDDKSKPDEDATLLSFEKTLGRVSMKFFRTEVDVDFNTKDDRFVKAAEFKKKYKDEFEGDFQTWEGVGAKYAHNKSDKAESTDAKEGESPHKAMAGLSLKEVHRNLKKWRDLLGCQVSMTPSSFPLQQASPPLSFFACEPSGLWPGACEANGCCSTRVSNDFEWSSTASVPSTPAAVAEAAADAASQAVIEATLREGVGGHVGGGTAIVEIPGQYAPFQAKALDSAPNPELHAKLVRFNASVETIQRKNQLHRRLSMIGSDGRTHKFLLQFAIPYWTRSDERTAQLHYVSGSLLRKDPFAARRSLSIQPTAVVAIAQRLRMTADKRLNSSIEDIYTACCQGTGRDSDGASDFFHREVVRLLGEDGSPPREGKEKGARFVESVKLQVYQEICQDQVESDILLNYIKTSLGTPERTYNFRRSFSRQIAIDSLLQYIFAVVERTPARFVFNILTGQMVSSDFRFDYNNQGFLEAASLPYRMTRNIQQLLGPLLLQGSFVPSFGGAANAICREEMSSILCLLLRDDIVSWYTSKSSARSDAKTQELERQLLDRVLKNAGLVQGRLKECVPAGARGDEVESKGVYSIDKRVRELLGQSTFVERLCMMPNAYEAWL